MPDDRCTLRQEINSLLSDGAADLIISTGGVSIGPRDYILDVLKELGAVIHFHGVAMRPGKPVLFATLPGGLPYFGLPGNPVAALVGFRFFVSTGLRKMQGLPVEQGTYFDLNLDGRKDLTVVLKAPAKLGDAPVILAGQESHKMLPLIGSNCWIAVTDTGGLRTTRHFPLNARF